MENLLTLAQATQNTRTKTVHQVVYNGVMGRKYPNAFVSIAAAVVLLLPGLIFFGLRLSAPFANDLLRPGTNSFSGEGLIVNPIDAAPAGLSSGDLVTHIDNRSLEAWSRDLFRLDAFRPQIHAGDTVIYRVIREGQPLDVEVTLGRYPLVAVVQQNWGLITFALVFFTLSAYVLARRPGIPAAHPLFISGASVLSATTWSLGMHAMDLVNAGQFWLYQYTTIVAFNMFWIAGLHFAVLFPRQLPVRWRRELMFALYTVPYILLAVYLLFTYFASNSFLAWISLWGPTTGLHGAVIMALMLIVVAWQYRANRHGNFRQQLRWLTWGAAVSGGLVLVMYLLPPLFGMATVDPNVMGMINLAFPAALTIAIVRHSLFDIDTLLNRTLVYGALTALIFLFYVVLVSALGTIFQTGANLYIALAVTGLVAVLFNPLRDLLQRRVNRLMFGERDDPATVFSHLGKRLESAAAPEAILPALVETISQTLKLPYVAILWFDSDGNEQMAVEYGRPGGKTERLPLIYQGEILGTLMVAQRSAEEPFSDSELWMLQNIARQAGTAVHVVRLTSDLQQSRQRIITAREEERRRIRRDLHDGLGPSLAAHMLTVGSARALLKTKPGAADQLLEQLESNLDATLVDVRRLVYNLRPPILDQLGFSGAVEACIAEYGQDALSVTLEIDTALPPLPAAVEVAAYNILREGLSNVFHHAQAKHCRVKVGCSQKLHLSTRDDGIGLPKNYRPGVGLTSMRERAEELGGSCNITSQPGKGTEIAAQFPLASLVV
jgi:two-component system, NarL family, sensor kinase